MPFAKSEKLDDAATRQRLRSLARQGCLAEHGFDVVQSALWPGASENQIEALKIAYFAGAQETLAVMMAAQDLSDGVTEGDMQFMDSYATEIEAFHRNTIAELMKRQSPAETTHG